jgi:N6-adenosine-specific RNA methylase IME4
MSALVKLDAAKRALDAACTIDDTKHVMGLAEAAAVFAKKAGCSRNVVLQAEELWIRSQRKCGELLAEMGEKRGGNQKTKSHNDTLQAVGINKSQSSRWQKIASIPDDAFESHIAQVKESEDKNLTASALLKLSKQFTNKQQKPAPSFVQQGESIVATDLNDLIERGLKYRTFYIDPPWKYSNQGTRASTDNHYETLSVDELIELFAAKVHAISEDEAHLHLWTTNAFLEDSFKVIRAFGFEYKSVLVWGKPQIGIGNYWRLQHEYLMLGIKSKLPFQNKGQGSLHIHDRTSHSTKPGAIRHAVEKVSPPKYIEMFGRVPVDGWTVFGNQVHGDLFSNE